MTLQHKEGRASDVQCGVYPSFAFHVFTSRARMRRPVGLHHTPGSARVSQQVRVPLRGIQASRFRHCFDNLRWSARPAAQSIGAVRHGTAPQRFRVSAF
jgi:hypothetical protein